MSTVSGSGSSDTPNPPTLQDRIKEVLREHRATVTFAPAGYQTCACGFCFKHQHDYETHLSDAVTQLLINMAGHSELLASIDRMYR